MSCFGPPWHVYECISKDGMPIYQCKHCSKQITLEKFMELYSGKVDDTLCHSGCR